MVNVMLIFFGSVMITYLIWISYLIMGKSKGEFERNLSTEKSIDIIIPTRNNPKTVIELIQDIQRQIKSSSNTQIIVIDDHSEPPITLGTSNDNIQLIQNDGTGKKMALQTGISKSNADWIVTLDDDISLPADWWNQLNKECNEETDLLILPIEIARQKGFLHYFQWLEFSILQQITQGSAGRKTPLLCNGAHLAVKKKLWLQYSENPDFHKTPSGDDQFLLEFFRIHQFNIRCARNSQLKVSTPACNTWFALLEQRRRWSAKAQHYSLWDMQFLGWITLLSNLGAFFFLCMWPCSDYPLSALFFFTIYLLIEFCWTEKTARRKPLSTFFFLLFYPFYVILTVLSFVIFRTHWKGREIRS